MTSSGRGAALDAEMAASARSVVVDVAPDQVFGTLHEPPPGEPAETAVLICPPWGWEEITSYRARRAWADRLAARGRVVLRIDLPGTGDSGGSAADPDRVAAWRAAIAASAATLACRSGIRRVVAIGMGLGGLLAWAAVADGAPIDALALWAVPATGRAWLREQRAFAALQATRTDAIDGPAGSGAPGDADDAASPAGVATAEPGTLEIGGFRLSGQTVEDLGSLEPAALPLGRVRHVLLLDRDGVDRTARLEETLAAEGIDVRTAHGHGWERMVFHPERYAEPTTVFETVDGWLEAVASAAEPRSAVEPRDPARLLETLTTTVGEVEVRETAVRIEQPFGSLFGILSEAPAAPRTDLVAVFLNAGAVRRVGPNRLWVEAARRWAVRGIPTLRADLEGIGDADGDPARYADVNLFYRPAFGEHVGAIVDDLERRGLGQRFVLIGLCAGAYWAFHRAADDRRVVAALLLNARAMIWDDDLLARREAHKVARLMSASTWSQVLRGQIGLRRAVPILRAVASTAIAAVRRAPTRLAGRTASANAAGGVVDRLDAIAANQTRLVLAFSGDEPVRDELEAEGILRRLGDWPNVELVTLPGRDHTLRPLVAQRAALALLDTELDRLLAGRAP